MCTESLREMNNSLGEYVKRKKVLYSILITANNSKPITKNSNYD